MLVLIIQSLNRKLEISFIHNLKNEKLLIKLSIHLFVIKLSTI